ncbi:hypothetical protein [Gordonia sp. MP11Mi]
MQIVLVDGAIAITYLDSQAPPWRINAEKSARHRGSPREPDPQTDSGRSTLPDLVGALVFVRRLGGAFFGHDQREVPIKWGDEVLILSSSNLGSAPGGKRIPPVTMQGRTWLAWQVTLPHTPSRDYETWLTSIDIAVQSPRWNPQFVTPPEMYRNQSPAVVFRPGTVVAVQNSDLTSKTSSTSKTGRIHGPDLEASSLRRIQAPTGVRQVEIRSENHDVRLAYAIIADHQKHVLPPVTVTVGDSAFDNQTPIVVDRDSPEGVIRISSAPGTTLSVTATEPLLSASKDVRRLLDAVGSEASGWVDGWSPHYDRFTIESTGTGTRTITFTRKGADLPVDAVPVQPESPAPDSSATSEVKPQRPTPEHIALATAPESRWRIAYGLATQHTSTNGNHWQQHATKPTCLIRRKP